MSSILSDFIQLIYPNTCVLCGNTLVEGETQICLSCLYSIPKTNFHLVPENSIEKRFWGKVDIHRASSFFYFQKGSLFQKLLHELKYKNNPEIGEIIGRFAGADLMDSPDFNSVDYIIPIPLHPKKLRKRGYNQSEKIANGIADILSKPVDLTHLIRTAENETQTRKSVFERYENTKSIFKLTDLSIFEGKHVLLIDDVLTTGSTLEACALEIAKTNNVKISIFTLAVA